ncbi:MAG TPA: pyridoxal-phosphate dependent enzyme, partial [Thermoanaerobaculia bacterium]|nr:pyridoxal-phosphate dependent enzyme [Thermoanaerobaculia bacterium]
MNRSETASVLVPEASASGVLTAIGNTPLVEVHQFFGAATSASIFAKLELLNPMGSSKDRAAVSMMLAAISAGLVIPGATTVIESTSGNTGVALASVCKFFRLPLICVVDGRMTSQHGNLLRAFGAKIEEVTVPDPLSGELLPARLRRVQELLESHKPSFWPNQYANANNAAAHQITCAEIFQQLGRAPDFIFCATGTCGTIRGCADYIAARGARTQLVAVDAVGSMIFGGPSQRRLIPGLGSAIRPPLIEGVPVERVVHVSEGDAVLGARRLLETEAILGGGSSGAVMSALSKCEDILRQPKTVVAILADSGE